MTSFPKNFPVPRHLRGLMQTPPADITNKTPRPGPGPHYVNPAAVGATTKPRPGPGPHYVSQTAVGPSKAKQQFVITGMFGIGDNLHQRAVIRELMKTYEVTLETCHGELYHDLVAKGLKLRFRPTALRAQAKTIARESGWFTAPPASPDAPRRRLGYNKPDIDKWGSIVHALYGMAGLEPVQYPDFSMPVKPEWRENARKLIASWDLKDKPLLVYRPIVLRREWDGSQRNPDTAAYNALFATIRNKFFVVSLADLAPRLEWIVGPEQEADIKLHAGELDFPTMAALFAEANLIFSPAGFAPVLAQAVGAPSITIYGGRESFKTTQRGGEHLAPTLGIDPDHPCDCHSMAARCNKCRKHITLEPAIARIADFVKEHCLAPEVVAVPKPRVLIYATTYVDCKERLLLTKHWLDLHQKLNPDCDFLLVDSMSPMQKDILALGKFTQPGDVEQEGQKLRFFTFPDNVGHLSRKGRDGWGRAFCYGLDKAVEWGYDYVVHIEGDSLFRLPCVPIAEQMQREGVKVASIPVLGTKYIERAWVETGLMFFSVKFLRDNGFTKSYNWPRQTGAPTPEVVIHRMLGPNLKMMPWKGLRGDKAQVNNGNILALDLDWVTHCHNDVWVYDKYIAHTIANMSTAQVVKEEKVELAQPAPAEPVQPELFKLNLGCGTNKVKGWCNHDADMDISKRLLYANNSCAFVFCEHCVEHIDYYAAIEFFRDCYRVLVPGGAVRITVPSIEQIQNCDNAAYFEFTRKWQSVGPAILGAGATARGAMHAILYAHGHKTAWTASLLKATLYYVGFEKVQQCAPGESAYPELQRMEGHHTVIGKTFNDIESLCVEGLKP